MGGRGYGGNHVFSANVAGTVTNVDADNAVVTYGLALLNTTAAVAYLQVFALPASSVTLGTTAPIASFGLPANGGLTIPFPKGWWPGGTALSIAGTTTRAGLTGAAIDVNLIHGG